MANLVEPKVGDILYPAYTVSQAFKVTKVEYHEKVKDLGLPGGPLKYEWYDVEGVTLKGKVVTHRARLFPSFTALVEDHRRKAEKFQKIIDKFNSQ